MDEWRKGSSAYVEFVVVFAIHVSIFEGAVLQTNSLHYVETGCIAFGTKMAGYSGTPLAKKLGIKEGFRVGLVNSPKGFQKELGDLPEAVTLTTEKFPKQLDLVLLFVDSELKLMKDFPRMMRRLPSNGTLWVAWPKKSSGVATDLSFDNVQKFGLAEGLVDVKICAVNDVWSGLKFVYRLKDR